MQVPQSLVIHTFFQHCKRPIFKKTAGTYNGECPYCNEGTSSGKKRRFFFMPQKNQLYCHNCGVAKNPLDFVVDQTGMSIAEIMSTEDVHLDTIEDVVKRTDIYKKINPAALPEDSINLFDSGQILFFKDNLHVQKALKFIKDRRLDTAVNRPRSLWLSLTDKVHKYRLIIPFYLVPHDYKITFYQSRTLDSQDSDSPKYLGKTNSQKTVFGLDTVVSNIEYIFIQEGPIDSMFLRNSVALAGIVPTQDQFECIRNKFPLHKLIYVLDNQWIDKTAYKETKKLLEAGETVFIWPEGLKPLKDLNEVCIHQSIDEIPWSLIVKHSYSGMSGIVQFSQIKLA